MQTNAEGDLSEPACRRAVKLANGADRSPTDAIGGLQHLSRQMAKLFPISEDDRLPLPGTVLTRKYKGWTVQVTVLPNGFEWEGERCASR